MAFQDKFVSLPFNKETSVEHMMKYCEELPFGSTDCSLVGFTFYGRLLIDQSKFSQCFGPLSNKRNLTYSLY